MKILQNMAKSAEFKFEANWFYINTNDESYLSIIQTLGLDYKIHDSNSVLIDHFSCEYWYFKDVIQKLEDAL